MSINSFVQERDLDITFVDLFRYLHCICLKIQFSDSPLDKNPVELLCIDFFNDIIRWWALCVILPTFTFPIIMQRNFPHRTETIHRSAIGNTCTANLGCFDPSMTTAMESSCCIVLHNCLAELTSEVLGMRPIHVKIQFKEWLGVFSKS